MRGILAFIPAGVRLYDVRYVLNRSAMHQGVSAADTVVDTVVIPGKGY